MAQSNDIPKSDIREAYASIRGTIASALFNAFMEKDYDQVRRLTGHTDVLDKWELLFRVGMEAGDPVYRQEHDIKQEQAFLVWRMCVDEYCDHNLDDERVEKLKEKVDTF